MILRVVTARVLLRPQWFFYIPIRDGTTISTWSSKPRKGLTICRCHSHRCHSYFKCSLCFLNFATRFNRKSLNPSFFFEGFLSLDYKLQGSFLFLLLEGETFCPKTQSLFAQRFSRDVFIASDE